MSEEPLPLVNDNSNSSPLPLLLLLSHLASTFHLITIQKQILPPTIYPWESLHPPLPPFPMFLLPQHSLPWTFRQEDILPHPSFRDTAVVSVLVCMVLRILPPPPVPMLLPLLLLVENRILVVLGKTVGKCIQLHRPQRVHRSFNLNPYPYSSKTPIVVLRPLRKCYRPRHLKIPAACTPPLPLVESEVLQAVWEVQLQQA